MSTIAAEMAADSVPDARPKRRRSPRPRSPIDGRSRLARRAKELQALYVGQLGGAAAVVPAKAIEISRVAELVALAEKERAAVMRGESAVSLDDLVRLERVAAAAVRALRLPIDQPKPTTGLLSGYLKKKAAE